MLKTGHSIIHANRYMPFSKKNEQVHTLTETDIQARPTIGSRK